jgi:hypothetical protein
LSAVVAETVDAPVFACCCCEDTDFPTCGISLVTGAGARTGTASCVVTGVELLGNDSVVHQVELGVAELCFKELVLVVVEISFS